jgi:hypothetical protein
MKREMKYSKLLLCAIGIFFCIVNIQAQEEAVSFDSKGKITKLTPNTAQKIGLILNEGSFKEAELFLQPDSSYIIEFHYEKNGKILRDRKPYTYEEIRQIRSNIDQTLIVEESSGDAMEGRALMVASSVVAGLSIYGPALPIIFDYEGSHAAGLYMLGAGAGFFVPYAITHKKPVSYGQANLYYYGLSRGFMHGSLFATSLYWNDVSVRSVYSFGTFFGLTESVIGYNFVKWNNVSNGTANLMTVYGDFGIFSGFAIANQLDLLDNRISPALVSLSSLGGIVAGYCLGKNNDISAGDAEIISTTGWLGAYLPLSFIAYSKATTAWYYTTPSLLTGIAGAYIGHKLTKNYNFTFSQGYLTKLGTAAGGLMGLGVVFMANGREPGTILLGSYIGAQLAFIAMQSMNVSTQKSNSALSRLKINVNPQNYLLTQNMKSTNPMVQSMFPLATLSYKF